MAEKDGYVIVKATIDDHDRLLHFLREGYFKYEPVNVAVGRSDNPSPEDVKYTLSFLEEGTSFLAVSSERDSDDIILGACINGDVSKDMTKGRDQKIANCPCPDFTKVLKYLAYVEDHANFWEFAGDTKALGIQALAVKEEARGRGIALKLLERSRELARLMGYPLLRIDCSSHFSAQLSQKIGMECAYTLPFSEYKDEMGKPILTPPYPHLYTKLFVQRL